MATVWLTYAWQDNENSDVDFVAQELEAGGLTVKLDVGISRPANDSGNRSRTLFKIPPNAMVGFFTPRRIVSEVSLAKRNSLMRLTEHSIHEVMHFL